MVIPFPGEPFRLSRCAAFAALAGLLAVGLPAAAQPGGTTLIDAQRMALARSLQLAAQQSAIAASREMAVAARQLPDPMLKAGIDNVPTSGPDRFSLGRDFMTMRRVGIEQELTRKEKRDLRGARFEVMADKAAAERMQAVVAIERDVALAWLDLYYLDKTAALVNDQVQQAETEVIGAEAGYRGGRTGQVEVMAARSALALVRDRVSEVEQRRQSARTMLARWIGEAAPALTAGTPDIGHLNYEADSLESHLVHHPELAVLRQQEEVARTEARLAQADRKADWRVEVSLQQRGSDYPNMVSVGVAVPLQWDRRHRQDREVSARMSQVAQAEAEREEAERAHAAETRALIGEWRTGLARLERFRSDILPLSEARTQAALASYRGGKSSLNDVLSARSAYLETAIQALQLESDTARLWARLNFLFPSTGEQARKEKQ